METTTDDSPLQQVSRADERAAPTLIVAHAANPALVGARQQVNHGRPMILGRTAKGALPGVFEDSSVSREHAKVGFAPSRRVVLTDLGSRNGTELNGRLLSVPTALRPGDVIRIGNVILVYQEQRPFVQPSVRSTLRGISQPIAHVVQQIAHLAAHPYAILVIGETGTGKEVVAEELHRHGQRSGRLVTLNCSSVAESLLHTELFGHARGAFTGAERARPGLLDTARQGTLFLDELTDASPAFQASLLRLLETGEYRQVGSDHVSQSDARFVAAAQPRLVELRDRGEFRQDLWMRLSSWAITLPPLRERPEDIPLLVQHFAAHAPGAGAPVVFSEPLLAALMRQPWPGNVRQLKNVVMRLGIGHSGAAPVGLAAFEDLDIGFRTLQARHEQSDFSATVAAAKPDSETLRACLKEHAGNVRRVAEHFGVTRKTLYRWCKVHGHDPTTFR